MLEKSLYAREKLQTLNLWNDTIFTTRLQDSGNILQLATGCCCVDQRLLHPCCSLYYKMRSSPSLQKRCNTHLKM